MGFPLDYLGTQGGQNDLPVMEHVEAMKHIEVINIYKNVNDNRCSIDIVQLDIDDFNRPRSADEHGPDRILVLQVACVLLLVDSAPYRLNIDKPCFDAMLKAFDLLKVQNIALSSVMTFDLLSRNIADQREGFDCSIFMVHYFGLHSHYSVEQNLTRAVVWCGREGLSRLKTVVEGLLDILEHPLCLLLITIVAFNALQDQRLAQISYFISTVEQRTGHHGDYAVAHPRAGEPLDNLSARMSGMATTIAANRRLNDLSSVVLKRTLDPHYLRHITLLEGEKSVQDRIDILGRILQDRVQIHAISIDLLESRAKIQLNAIFNMLAQNEMKLSLLVARDSHKIAAAVKRDSTAMKVLATVTVFFLPATFIASLFSTSMFRWQTEAQSSVSPQLWIYWAVALPLTAITCTVCYGLSSYWTSSNRLHDEEAEKVISAAFI